MGVATLAHIHSHTHAHTHVLWLSSLHPLTFSALLIFRFLRISIWKSLGDFKRCFLQVLGSLTARKTPQGFWPQIRITQTHTHTQAFVLLRSVGFSGYSCCRRTQLHSISINVALSNKRIYINSLWDRAPTAINVHTHTHTVTNINSSCQLSVFFHKKSYIMGHYFGIFRKVSYRRLSLRCCRLLSA